jgi:hypothetical protein
MNSSNNLFLEDKVLSFKAFIFGTIGRTLAERAVLEQLLELRTQCHGVDHVSLVSVLERLAQTYAVSYAASDLHQADELVQEALRILLLTSTRGANTFRAGKLIHARCEIHQRLNQPVVALELGEEALAIYNSTALASSYRASLMHTLVYLHNQVGVPERAERLAIEVRSLDYVLSSRSGRHRY